MEIENKLKEMGFELPNPPLPAANYIGCVRVGNLLFVGGNIGRINGELRYSGKVGDKVTLEQAYEAGAQLRSQPSRHHQGSHRRSGQGGADRQGAWLRKRSSGISRHA